MASDEEVTKRQVAGAAAPRSNLAPLWTDLPPLLSPTLPNWIEAEIRKRKTAGANAPKVTLAPLWTDQEFPKNAAGSSVSFQIPNMSPSQRALPLKDQRLIVSPLDQECRLLRKLRN